SGLPQYSLFDSHDVKLLRVLTDRDNGITRSLGARDLGISIDEGLLIDASHSLQIADIERVLRTAIAGMLALEFAMGLLLRLGLLQRGELGLGQHQALQGALGFQCLETLVHVLKVVTLPHTAHPGGRDRKPALPQLVGDAQLTEGGLLDGKRNDGILDLLWNAI